MGYCMDQRECKFRIKAENKQLALTAIQNLATQTSKMSGGSWHGGQQVVKWFGWVNTSDFVNAPDLKTAMTAWRWEIDEDENGNVVDIWFTGEKLGDDVVLFEAIAPFVEHGSFIEMGGEDGAIWRWVFKDGKVEEKSASIHWDD